MNLGWFLDEFGLFGGELEVERKQNGENDQGWPTRRTRGSATARATVSATACGPLCPGIVVRCKNIF